MPVIKDRTDKPISEHQDEILPENVTTEMGGFYVNCGKLKFRTRSSNTESEGSPFKEEKEKETRIGEKKKKKNVELKVNAKGKAMGDQTKYKGGIDKAVTNATMAKKGKQQQQQQQQTNHFKSNNRPVPQQQGVQFVQSPSSRAMAALKLNPSLKIIKKSKAIKAKTFPGPQKSGQGKKQVIVQKSQQPQKFDHRNKMLQQQALRQHLLKQQQQQHLLKQQQQQQHLNQRQQQQQHSAEKNSKYVQQFHQQRPAGNFANGKPSLTIQALKKGKPRSVSVIPINNAPKSQSPIQIKKTERPSSSSTTSPATVSLLRTNSTPRL